MHYAVIRSLTGSDCDQPGDDPAVGVGRSAPHSVLALLPRSVVDAAVQSRAGTVVTVAGEGQNVQRPVVKAPGKKGALIESLRNT